MINGQFKLSSIIIWSIDRRCRCEGVELILLGEIRSVNVPLPAVASGSLKSIDVALDGSSSDGEAMVPIAVPSTHIEASVSFSGKYTTLIFSPPCLW